MTWIINEEEKLDYEAKRVYEAENIRGMRVKVWKPLLAINLNDVVIYDNRKWWGEAEIRLDALIVHGNAEKKSKSVDLYMPKTFRFPRVQDGDKLPIGDGGLLIFLGKPAHFLDIFLMVSRNDEKDDDLEKLLAGKTETSEMKDALKTILKLANPQLAIFTGALEAAAKLGSFTYRLLSDTIGKKNVVGLYRTSWLEYRDRYGIGTHPSMDKDPYIVHDLSFRYEIIEEKKKS